MRVQFCTYLCPKTVDGHLGFAFVRSVAEWYSPQQELQLEMAEIMAGTVLATGAIGVAQGASDPLRVWVGDPDAAAMHAWVQGHLDEAARLEAQLLAVKGARTVENTLAPFDEATRALDTANSGANLLSSASPKKELRDAAQVESQRIRKAWDELSLNRAVYEALCAVDLAKADAPTKFYMEKTLREYRLAGVDKDEATRNKVRDLQDKLTGLMLSFQRNVDESIGHIEVKDVAELDGLPADYIARHPANSEGVITITTDEPDYGPVMTYAKSTALRQRIFTTYNTRAYPANKDLLLQVLGVRSELAQLLGFASWAELATADKMVATPANVRLLIEELDKAARPVAAKEKAELIAFAKSKDSSITEIPEYSSSYWMEQYRREIYGFDSQSVRSYFPFAQVQEGVLHVASRLFHISFVQVKDAEVWDPSVTVFDVTDGVTPGGTKLGRIYMDMHPREGKDKWFDSDTVVAGKRDMALPEARLNGNFAGGGSDDSGLMEYEDVVIFFHEFGHMMHNVLGAHQEWEAIGPFSVEWDFVEAPSQMLEEFFANRGVIDTFAKDAKTGAPMPKELFDKMVKAGAFARGIFIERQLMLAEFSLTMHDRAPQTVDLDTMLHEGYLKYGAFTESPENRMYTTFTHLMDYSSNYYTYMQSKVIAVDFFAQFDQENLLDGPTAMRYRKTVLEPGGSVSANTLVKNFLGRPQNYEAVRKWINEEFAAPVK